MSHPNCTIRSRYKVGTSSVWETKEGITYYCACELEESHLLNLIKWLERGIDKEYQEGETHGYDSDDLWIGPDYIGDEERLEWLEEKKNYFVSYQNYETVNGEW